MREKERGIGRKGKRNMTLKMIMILCRQIIYFDLFTLYSVYSNELIKINAYETICMSNYKFMFILCVCA